MALISAGLVVWRRRAGGREVLLVHPGGPFWSRKDAGAWSIPKGLVEPGEDLLAAALREYAEEVAEPPPGPFAPLPPIRQKGGKIVHAFAVEGELDPAAVRGSMMEMEWPRGSGRILRFPEIDRAAWFARPGALEAVLPAQAPLIEAALAPD